jgi:hypothetical protein
MNGFVIDEDDPEIAFKRLSFLVEGDYVVKKRPVAIDGYVVLEHPNSKAAPRILHLHPDGTLRSGDSVFRQTNNREILIVEAIKFNDWLASIPTASQFQKLVYHVGWWDISYVVAILVGLIVALLAK